MQATSAEPFFVFRCVDVEERLTCSQDTQQRQANTSFVGQIESAPTASARTTAHDAFGKPAGEKEEAW